MDRVKAFISAVTVDDFPITLSMNGRHISMAPLAPNALEDTHHELFTLLTDYSLAVARSANRIHLMEILDATIECVQRHFRSVEALLEQISWTSFQQHHVVHYRITEELEAFRNRLAGDDPLDAVECAHVLDAMLIQIIREQPMIKRLHARLNRKNSRLNTQACGGSHGKPDE